MGLFMNTIQDALARKKLQALAIVELPQVQELRGVAWLEFLQHMDLMIHRLGAWDQIIACNVHDILNERVA